MRSASFYCGTLPINQKEKTGKLFSMTIPIPETTLPNVQKGSLSFYEETLF